VEEILEKIKKLLKINPPPDINSQYGNHSWNTALHFGFKIYDFGAVNFLLTQGT
jgi:hypothetical protein